MYDLERIINCNNFIKFYKEYGHTTVNLFKKLNDEEIVRPYDDGLNELECLLSNHNPDVDSQFSKEISKFLEFSDGEWDKNYRQVLTMIYKLLNPHYLSADLSVEEVKSYFNSYSEWITESCEFNQSFSRKESKRVVSFFHYAISLKISRACFIINGMESTITSDTSLSVTEMFRQSELTQKYTENNKFFTECGFYYPKISFIDESFFENNIDMFDIIPNKTPGAKYVNEFRLAKPNNESQLEVKIIGHLNSFIHLLKTKDINIEIMNQEKFTMGTSFSKPDIVLILENNYIIPVELKMKNLRKIYYDYLNSRDHHSKASKSMIELFSQSFHQGLCSRSCITCVSDGDFALCFLFDTDSSSNMNYIYNIRPVSCVLIPFDPKEYRTSVCIFIILIAVVYFPNLKVDDDKFSKFRTTFTISKYQKTLRAQEQYIMLDEIAEMISRVAQDESSIRLSNLYTASIRSNQSELENIREEWETNNLTKEISEIDQRATSIQAQIEHKWNLKLNLSKLAKVLRHFNFCNISLTDIEVDSIISGANLHMNYSTVVLSRDGFIYKVYDPIRGRIELTNEVTYFSFHDALIKSFDLFCREISCYDYLHENFANMPNFLELGYLTNDNKGYDDTLTVEDSFPLQGFYIKLSKVPGSPLSQLKWSKDIEKALRGVIEKLHSLGVSHGDVHLGNFIYDAETGFLYVIDFGLSYLGYYRGNNPEEEDYSIDHSEQRFIWDNSNLDILIQKMKG